MEISLYYDRRGTGVPLVLLHGNGEDGSYFAHQIEAFSKEYQVIAVDTRGHGQSPRGTAPFTLAQFAQDLKDLLDQLGLRRVLLLGFSDGANIALLFTLRWPEYVAGLILNGGNLDPKGVKAGVQLPICLGYGLVSAIAAFDPKARAKKELLRLMVKEPHIAPKELKQIACPTLVIAGERDMIREDHTRQIAASIPGAELVLLPGSHFVANENSAAFNQAVLAFLRRRKKEGGAMTRLGETLRAYQARDPAARSRLEIFLLYPGVHAIIYHRIAHFLYRHNLKFLARAVSQWSRCWTGIEIHPGAKIGRRLVIDHGMGIVIGETAEVGDDCLIYHGVTLGGTGKDQGKRHPTLGNNVMVSTGAKVLGPFKVGDNSRIAANAVVLSEIPPDSTAVGVPARVVRIAGERVDYASQVDQINVTDPLQKELQALQSRLDLVEQLLDKSYMEETK